MFEALGAIVGLLSLTLMILPYVLIYYLALRFRTKFFIVHEFSNENVKLPEVVNKVGNEITIKYANSFTKSNQFYMTSRRIIFHCQSLLKGKFFTKYFETNSVRNVEIIYKNPYGWLIVAGLEFLVWLIYVISAVSHSSSSSNSYSFYTEKSSSMGAGTAVLVLFFAFIESGLFVLIWHLLKGYYLMFDNGTISGLFCRSREGLEDTLKRFDIFKFSNKSADVPELKREVPQSRDIICRTCKSVISLDSDDLKSSSFICPICTTENAIV